MKNLVISNDFWKLVVEPEVNNFRVHVGTNMIDESFPQGLYINSEEIDELVFYLLKAKRKFNEGLEPPF